MIYHTLLQSIKPIKPPRLLLLPFPSPFRYANISPPPLSLSLPPSHLSLSSSTSYYHIRYRCSMVPMPCSNPRHRQTSPLSNGRKRPFIINRHMHIHAPKPSGPTLRPPPPKPITQPTCQPLTVTCDSHIFILFFSSVCSEFPNITIWHV